MKNTLLILTIALAFAACKKSDNSSSSPVQNTANSIGLLFEHKYHVAASPAPGFDTLSASDTIIFHTNGTITEYRGLVFDTTYNVVYIPVSGLVTSIYQNGAEMQVVIPGTHGSGYTRAVFLNSCAFAQQGSDTLTMATYESGPVVNNNIPTLGCTFGGYGNVSYLWLN